MLEKDKEATLAKGDSLRRAWQRWNRDFSLYANNSLVFYETVPTEPRELFVNRQNKVSDPQKLKRCHVSLNLILKCCCSMLLLLLPLLPSPVILLEAVVPLVLPQMPWRHIRNVFKQAK